MVLRMKGNKINEEAAAKLGQAMKEHPRLASIELQATQVDGVDLGVLRVVPGSEVSMENPVGPCTSVCVELQKRSASVWNCKRYLLPDVAWKQTNADYEQVESSLPIA